MEVEKLDALLVPLGLGFMGLYHVWLVITIKRDPRSTVIGLNAETHKQWIICLMSDPLSNGVLEIQTIRNSVMASTFLATAAITLSSIIGVFVSSTSNPATSLSLVYGNKTAIVSAIKYFTLMVCFLVSFVCNVQSIRYYGHVSFLCTLPSSKGKKDAMIYAARSLNRASFFWSLGLRAFYFSFPLFLWIFGPIPMFVSCCLMLVVLYFLDTTTTLTQQLHRQALQSDTHMVEPDALTNNGIHTLEIPV